MRKLLLLASAICLAAVMMGGHVVAAEGNFSLQVTPSPLVASVNPGASTQLELKIRNGGTDSENLKIEPRSFKINSSNGQVELNDTAPPDIASWIHFDHPAFTVLPGQWFTEEINLDVPKDAGFSYSFALVISRQSETQPTNGGRLIKGSVAVFSLINVNRPGATSKLDLAAFTSVHHFYEYLPATFDIHFKNTGNTIVQPSGNIFIQRGSTDRTPLATLDINNTKGYILPGSTRTLTSSWDDGFPAYQTVTAADGSTKQQLKWNWSKLSSFRIGRYTAKLVAVYSDGQHDVPIMGEVSFWVIPWKILLGLFIVGLLLLLGLWSIVRKLITIVKRHKRRPPTPQAPQS